MSMQLYTFQCDEGTNINMTLNPSIDYEYYKNKYKNSFSNMKLLTPEMSISDASYIMNQFKRAHNSFEKYINYVSIGKKLKSQFIKGILLGYGSKLLKRSKPVLSGYLPKAEYLEYIMGIINGRVISFSQLYDLLKEYEIDKSIINDSIQYLYLNNIVDIFPAISIEGLSKKQICKWCGSEVSAVNEKCPFCNNLLEQDQILIAKSYEKQQISNKYNIKYREVKGLNNQEIYASDKLCLFLEGKNTEMFFWSAPYYKNYKIFMDSIRLLLDQNKSIALVFPCNDIIKEFIQVFKYHFYDFKYSVQEFNNSNIDLSKSQNYNLIYNNLDSEVFICKYSDIKTYYKAFDAVFLFHESYCTDNLNLSILYTAKRSIKDNGKIVCISSSPTNEIFKRIEKEDIGYITVPLKSNMPIREPRVVINKFFTYKNIFIPDEVINFIKYSCENNQNILIVVSYSDYIDKINELLSMTEINKFLNGDKKLIYITTPNLCGIYANLIQNVIVFFADDNSLYSENTLLNIAGIAGNQYNTMQRELFFIAAYENDVIYNVKAMLRFLNKSAWEMGYIK